MSATRPFLEQVVRRFTGLSRERRSWLGLPVAFLALDAHASELRGELLSPLAVPGLLELAPTEGAKKGLLHAKVALLEFGESRSGPPSALRLVVTTANWTDRSARQQLELAWFVDVSCGSRSTLATANLVDRADIAAAGAFARRVLKRYDVPSADRDGLAFADRLHELLNRCEEVGPGRGTRPRFVHSLDGPLFGKLEVALRGKHELNFLACGSGSFESIPKTGRNDLEPKVLNALSRLVPEGVSKVVAVEPANAGALAGWAHRAEEDGWSLREPWDSVHPRTPRSLHAKFVLIGHAHRGRVLRGSLYLGSGNLTFRGFRWGVPQHGNIECGVILPFSGPCRFADALESLYVSGTIVSAKELASGAADDEPDVRTAPLIETPPLRGVRICQDEVGAYLELHWRAGLSGKARFRVLVGDRVEEVTTGVERVRLPDEANLGIVRVERGKGVEPWVIVVERHGHCVAPLGEPPSSFDEVMARLFDFPAPADDGADDEDEDGGDAVPEPETPAPTATQPAAAQSLRDDVAKYPLQKAMEFLDGLGAHQARVPPYLLDDWVQHLDVMLDSQFCSEDLQPWRGAGIPFRRALLAPGFRPSSLDAIQLRRYRAIVDRFLRVVEGS
jgi:hypothetical protein